MQQPTDNDMYIKPALMQVFDQLRVGDYWPSAQMEHLLGPGIHRYGPRVSRADCHLVALNHPDRANVVIAAAITYFAPAAAPGDDQPGDDQPGVSPFDRIRRVRPDGTEIWTARDLQPLMGYTNWQNFSVPLKRAMQAAENQNIDLTSHFMGSHKMVNRPQGGGVEQVDYELSRLAAYLVAMNGDPNKPEVAAAQLYFAVMTRAAETATSIAPALDLSDPIAAIEAANTRSQAAIEIAKAERARAERAEERAERGAQFRRAIEAGDGITLTAFHKKYFSSVRESDFFNHLYAKKWLINQIGKGAVRTSGPRAGMHRDGSEHRHPTFKGKPYMYLHGGRDDTDHRRENTRVRPGVHELQFRDLLVGEGLPANENTAGLFALKAVR